MFFFSAVLAQTLPTFIPSTTIPALTPGIIPTLINTTALGNLTIPALTPSGAPTINITTNITNITTSTPATTPAIVPTFIPGYAPASFTPSSGLAVAISSICGSCTLGPNTTTQVINGNTYQIGTGCFGCVGSRRQPLVAPAIFALPLTTQGQCNDFFTYIICSSDAWIVAFRAANPTMFANLVCICLATNTTGCPSCSHSKKGLLGLLGLLGLIPLCLLLLLCCLCLIRRRKRQQDVHFATFDPAAANLALPASHIAPPCASVPFAGPGAPCF